MITARQRAAAYWEQAGGLPTPGEARNREYLLAGWDTWENIRKFSSEVNNFQRVWSLHRWGFKNQVR